MRTTHGSARSDAARAARPRRHGTVSRLLIERLTPPNPDGWPAKRIVGDRLEIGADVCADSGAALAAEITYRVPGEPRWRFAPMRHDAGADRWLGSIRFPTGGLYRYAVQAWIDPFAGWQQRMRARLAAAALEPEMQRERAQGAALLRDAAGRADGADTAMLQEAAAALDDVQRGATQACAAALGERVRKAMRAFGARHDETRSSVLEVRVERKRARVGSWYAVPLQLGGDAAGAGVDAHLQDIARLGFDVVCLPAGTAAALRRRFLEASRAIGVEVALEWAPGEPSGRNRRRRAAGRLDFWGSTREGIWTAEHQALRAHIRAGLRAFWVREPLAWPLPFWHWLIASLHAEHPDVVFVCASTPASKPARALAEVGFSQTVRELPRGTPDEMRQQCAGFATRLLDVERPHVRVDVRAGSRARVDLLLAATLSPAFSVAADIDALVLGPLGRDLRVLHRIRRENRALQTSWNVVGLETENPALLGIWRGDGRNDLLVVANQEPDVAQSGWLHVPARLGAAASFTVRDLLTGETYTWCGPRNYVHLDPQRGQVGHILRIERPGLSALSDALPGA